MRKDTAFIETHRSSAGGPEGGRGACSTWPEAAGTSCSDRNTGHRPERRNSTEAKCSPILGPILHDYSTSAKFILFQPASRRRMQLGMSNPIKSSVPRPTKSTRQCGEVSTNGFRRDPSAVLAGREVGRLR